MSELLRDTDFIDLPLYIKGKVRDVYDLGDKLLVVATDRLSAFDVVFGDLIPNKGKVLTKLSEFWFDFTKDIIGNHFITADVNQFPPELIKYKDKLEGRSMIVKKVEMVEAECIVRGYLEGAALKEYNETGSVCGIRLPEGLRQGDKLPEPIFTPSTKAKDGSHDENVTINRLAGRVGAGMALMLKEASMLLYKKASRYAESRGIILADTKFEFGVYDGYLVLADEAFTPDSSRFWDMSEYEPGRPQKSFDKQFVREYLESIGWDKQPPAPKLPEEIIKKTEAKYIEAYERLTGEKFE